MKLQRILTLAAVAMLTVAAWAQQSSVTFNDEARNQTVVVTAITNDIVRVEVRPAPNITQAQPATPSLVLDEAMKTAQAQAKVSEAGDLAVLTTASGMRVVCDKRLKSVSASCGSTFFTTDLCGRDLKTVRLLHGGQESFYGAGERGYSFNLVGDTLKTVSGGSHPGLFHVQKNDDNYTVTAFEQVEDGAGNEASARRVFGDYYESFHQINRNADEREAQRANDIAEYVKKHGLKASVYQDYGWPAVPLKLD